MKRIDTPVNVPRGAALIVAASLCFAGMGAAVKIASQTAPTTIVVFLRSLFGLIALVPWLLITGIEPLRTRRPGIHLVRGLSGLAAMACFFYSIAHLPLAEAVLLNFTTPLFIPFFAAYWLHERVAAGLAGAIALGFVGVALVLKPGTGVLDHAAWIGLASGALAAVALVCVRAMRDTEPTLRIVFYYSMFCTVCSALPLTWTWTPPTTEAWLALALAGVLATAGQLFLTHGYRQAPAARVGPFSYSTVLFAAMLAWIAWSEVPGAVTVLGAALIVAAGAAALRAEGPLAAPVGAGDEPPDSKRT